jgi:peroxiredoxin
MPEAAPRRPPVALLVIAVVSGLVAIVSGVVAFGGDDEPTSIALEPVLEGQRVPDVSFPMWTGETRTFADFAGTPLVVNFFSSTCAPCIEEMPDLEAAHQTFAERVTFLGISFQDRRSDAQRIVDQTGVTYPLAEDLDGTVFNALEANVMPTTVFISAQGEVVDVRSGLMSADEIQQRVERLIAT